MPSGTVCEDLNSHIVPTARGKRDFYIFYQHTIPTAQIYISNSGLTPKNMTALKADNQIFIP